MNLTLQWGFALFARQDEAYISCLVLVNVADQFEVVTLECQSLNRIHIKHVRQPCGADGEYLLPDSVICRASLPMPTLPCTVARKVLQEHFAAFFVLPLYQSK